MKTALLLISLCLMMFLTRTGGVCASFDDRFWQKYAEIQSVPYSNKGSLLGVTLDAHQLGDCAAVTPFADFRVVSTRKEELPWQIVSRKPQIREEEVSCRMRNLSSTDNGDTWVELLVDKAGKRINAVHIMIPDADYIRQVQILGSQDGKAWNMIRQDGLVFDMNRGEKQTNTRITFPETSYSHLALKIINNGAKPLRVNAVKALQQNDLPGKFYQISGTLGKYELNATRKESSIIVRMENAFPIDCLLINTQERNFQRSVTIQVRGKTGEWNPVAEGTVFSFDSPTAHSSQLEIALPGIAAKEYRLVFMNYDSPPFALTGVSGKGYERVLVFKGNPEERLYLFWGNPLAKAPHYDLAGAIMPETMDELELTTLAPAHDNPGFLGDEARKPFTERYKLLLYVAVGVAIAGLFLMQYRVLKLTGSSMGGGSE